MKATEQILQIIKREGSANAKSIATALDITSMGARQHLQQLQDKGLLRFEDVKVKVGRPNRHWSLTAKGHSHFADRHGDLTVQFIDAIEELYGEDGLNKVALLRSERTLDAYQEQLSAITNIEEKLNALVMLRERDGYIAELFVDSDGYTLVENHCPICKAATRCDMLCQSELTIFKTLLGSNYSIIRTEHIISGQRRCSYKITTAQ
ncbi:transcriptional regulator [Vibrio sp. ZSDZ34]|uniref:Transcriptional regulator n=1 Tax=Vibrio gelatinilyticus TaxID=2893468 RepID=A0A9X1WC00_9VIBR|nr:metalloregulator ArsR/SmtB family transcription factor [Vibrio gelatinilyticus]MCJ2378122.1 transcriptional regulator [Vibrio gelatinilyticus]